MSLVIAYLPYQPLSLPPTKPFLRLLSRILCLLDYTLCFLCSILCFLCSILCFLCSTLCFLCSTFCLVYYTMSSGSSAKIILLSDHRDTLLAYEEDYRLSKGSDCQDIVKQIIEEIAPQGKGKLRHDAMKGLESVSQLFIK